MSAAEKAAVLAAVAEIARLLELEGENPFKVRAWEGAQRTLAGLDDLLERAREGRLRELPGIGETIARAVGELVATGRIAYLDELRAKSPPGLAAIARVPGVGPRRARAIVEATGAGSLEELERACREGRVAGIRGLGEKSQQKILDGIELLRRRGERLPLGEARALALPLRDALAACPAAIRVEVAGSLRRWTETVADVDLLAATGDAAAVTGAAAALPGVEHVLARGDTRASVRLASGLQVDVRAVVPEAFPFALVYFTGSKEHNVALRARAITLGLKLNEYGLFREDGSGVACAGEEEVYAALGLAPVPPELREGTDEVELAARGALPRLLPWGSVRGSLHNHTDASDGRNTLAEMVRGARERGWAYLGISDHSAAAAYAHGLDRERLEEQLDRIDALEAQGGLGLRLLRGTEADVLPDGTVDLPPDLRPRLDVVVASVHSRFDLPQADMTRRVLAALEDPDVTVLGHPTGRLLGIREPYALDLEAVIEACAREGVAIEINGNPRRLDLEWRWARRARERGARFVVSADAHSVADLDRVETGVAMARKAGLEAGDVVNTRELDGLRAFLDERRRRARARVGRA